MLSYVLNSNGTAVDFPAYQRDGHREMIRLCANLANLLTRQRELQALHQVRQEHAGREADALRCQAACGWLVDPAK